MNSSSRSAILTFTVVLVLAALAQAQTFTTLYNFTGGAGRYLYSGVIQDPAGNMYGSTYYGGDRSCNAPYGCGVVFELNTDGTETVLHSFSDNPDGALPLTPVVRDMVGDIYGTTVKGGNSGYGTVFKIESAGHEMVLYSFTGGSDGCTPYQGLVTDNAGNLYGTTALCGASGYGTIFEVDSAGTFTVLHSFAGEPSDGATPNWGHLIMDTSGNLFGVTLYGGASDHGVLYELSNSGTFTVLHNFAGGASDGCRPVGSVVQDKAGNFYGTTMNCGSHVDGTIWKLSKTGTETILYNFGAHTPGGCFPSAGVARDSKGNLYGGTGDCAASGRGALYELSAKARFTVLHSFRRSEGRNPLGEVLLTSQGTLFGTTYQGGTYGGGTVWEYVP